MTGGVESMVASMEALLGLGEDPPGSNRNHVTDWYGVVGPWCDMSVTYAAYDSHNVGPVCFGYKHDYTVEHATAFYNHGQWHTDVAGIQRGDVVFFDWAGTNSIAAIDHVGVVTSVDPDGTVHTIEGNIDNQCERRTRHADFIAGYGRPAYVAPPAPLPVPKPVPAPVRPPLPKVSLSLVQEAHDSTAGRVQGSDGDVALVQNALAKLGLISFKGRGQFGPLTAEAYAAYQRHLGYTGKDADGRPGATSLTRLGTASAMFTEST